MSHDGSDPTKSPPTGVREHASNALSPEGLQEIGLTEIEELQRELNRLQRSIRLAIQSHLQKLAGRSFGSLKQNQQMAQSVHSLLEGHGLRVRCSECGHPAILRVSPRAGIEHGAFVFDHTIESGRTFHGGRAVMPEIRLIAKPARKKTSPEKKAAG